MTVAIKVCRTCGRSDVKFESTRKQCRGCRGHNRFPSNRFLQSKRQAARRGKTWTITLDEFKVLITLPCTYCHASPGRHCGSGLDRKDNDRGYEPDNVVPACRECNNARNRYFTYDEMFAIGAAIRQVKLGRQPASV